MATMFGVLVFLLLLGFTVQFMFHLYARSVIRSETYAAATDAAGFVASDGCAAATADVHDALPRRFGSMGSDATVEVDCAASHLTVRVEVDPPTALPRFFGDSGLLGVVERSVTVRIEELQDAG